MADSKDKDKKSHAPEHGGAGFSDTVTLGGEGDALLKIAGGLGVVGVGASVALGGGLTGAQFQHSYLAAFMWGLSIGAGALWWVVLQHLMSARWSVAVRRVGEIVAQSVLLLALLSLPLVIPILGHNDILYKWVNHEYMESNHALHAKSPYLNTTFFAIRWIAYFVFWGLMARYYLNKSVKQDKSGDAGIVKTLAKASPVTMIGFALTITFCAIDFVMSLDAMWFSTIFGVYFFASCVLSFHSVLVLGLMWLQGKGRLTNSVTVEHYHDIGKMMFAFIAFWTYIAFSQFMLIWYANIPEETHWFKDRMEGNWLGVSLFLVAVHFVIPFFGMMSRQIKRNKKTLGFWAVWILAVVWLDMHWLIAPNLHRGGLSLSVVDFTSWIGVGGLLLAFVVWSAKKVNLLPTKDPRLERSLAFENI